MVIRFTVITLAALTVYAFMTMDYGSADIREAIGETLT